MASNSSQSFTEETSSLTPVRIVIIGAGVSGLTCAHYLTKLLKKRSHQITVLEARDRIGGRTLSIAEFNLDLGASWIFADHSAVRALAREFDIDTINQYESGASLFDTGRGNVQSTVLHGIHGGASRLKGGTGSLCAAISAELTSRHVTTVNVQLNSPVSSINYRDDHTMFVILSDHRSFVADYVVLALPPKLLMSTIQLRPNLPTTLTKQLSQCATWMASTCKAILVYDRPWWQHRKLSGFAVSRRSKVQEWHDASSNTCNALFAFCLAGTSQEEVIEATITLFGDDARNPTAVHMTDWSSEPFTSSSIDDGRGGHPHTSDATRQPQWNGRLWFGNSEVSEMDGGFIEGAVQRGTKVANEIATLILSQ